jgi:hypothetical protein
MTNWTNKSKNSSTFTNHSKVIAALYGVAVYGVSIYGKASVWANKAKAAISFLLNEDATYLLLETGERIIIAGDEWMNKQKA